MNENWINNLSCRNLNIKNQSGQTEVVSALVTNMPTDDGGNMFSTEENGIAVNTGNEKDSKKKYVSWGADNELPQNVIKASNRCPYVGPSLKHLIDSTFSGGIKEWYVYYVYRNGKMEREQIEYEAAGKWIRQQIKELQSAEKGTTDPSAFVSTSAKKQKVDNSDEIAELKKDLTAWTRTMELWKAFKEENNLSLWLYEQASDAQYFWNWFAGLELNVGEPDEPWSPLIKRVTHLEATCMRKGVMDAYGAINYCVYSRWFGEEENTKIGTDDVEEARRQILIDALDPGRAAAQLREIVERQKENRPRSRVTRYVLPLSMPTPGRRYYAFPSWHTIFESRIYQYVLAMFARRAVLMQNSTMFKYIIRLNRNYLEYEYNRLNADNDEDKKKIYDALIGSIELFLSDPRNNGKALTTIEDTTQDGKNVKWVEIENIESPMKGSDVKEDISEMANVMLFAMGIHPQTVGAIPGKDKMASGTEARELNTLQQLYLLPLKMLLLTPLYVTKSFNRLDSHFYLDIPVHVLTTLDKNKQGVEPMKNE